MWSNQLVTLACQGKTSPRGIRWKVIGFQVSGGGHFLGSSSLRQDPSSCIYLWDPGLAHSAAPGGVCPMLTALFLLDESHPGHPGPCAHICLSSPLPQFSHCSQLRRASEPRIVPNGLSCLILGIPAHPLIYRVSVWTFSGADPRHLCKSFLKLPFMLTFCTCDWIYSHTVAKVES